MCYNLVRLDMDSVSSLVNMPKRHYKKDSRFTNDLYTLTYDDNESLDTVELLSVFNTTVSAQIYRNY